MTKDELAGLIFDYWRRPSPPYDAIVKPAFRPEVAAAFVGSQEDEYGLEWPPPSGVTYGIGSWDKDRRERIASSAGIDVRAAGPLEQQRALWWELRHVQAQCLFVIHSAQAVEDETEATERTIEALTDRFEYGKLRERDKAKRLEYALAWRDKFERAA